MVRGLYFIFLKIKRNLKVLVKYIGSLAKAVDRGSGHLWDMVMVETSFAIFFFGKAQGLMTIVYPKGSCSIQ